MVHTVKIKKGISKLVMLLLPNMTYLEGETSHKLNQPKKQSFIPFPEHAVYQKDTLLIFILIAGVFLRSSIIWGCYGNKGVFLRLQGP